MVKRDAEGFRSNGAVNCFVALTGGLGADQNGEPPVLVEEHLRRFVIAAGTGFHVVADAEAAQLAALFGVCAARFKSCGVGALQRGVHEFLVTAGIINWSQCRLVWKLVGSDEILAAQLH